ncbi:hypothetical protein NVP1088O_18 [Vibrio phage 1.088.O._10N.261.46.A1]|nr:hypothetical protein NVP1088O_18 [Vibrio phage 1.088.O._10N.261.46.A1]
MSSEAKFTQGPWVARGSTPSRIYGMQRADKEVIIAATGSVLENSGVNAYLIAAAPEMYGTLETILEIGKLSSHQEDIVSKLLAKARGEI